MTCVRPSVNYHIFHFTAYSSYPIALKLGSMMLDISPYSRSEPDFPIWIEYIDNCKFANVVNSTVILVQCNHLVFFLPLLNHDHCHLDGHLEICEDCAL